MFWLISLLFSQWTLLIGILIFVIYKWSTSTYDYFEKRNIPFQKPVPFFGNMLPLVIQTGSILERVKSLYMKFRNYKFFGLYDMRQPVIVINDPELIRKITIKDFDHFLNHKTLLNPEDEPLFANNLFSLKDQKWKDMRSTLSPAFTGSKMRLMFQFVERCCNEAINYLKREAKTNGTLELEMKEFFTKFTTDVIATCAFGIEINSLSQKDNKFYKMGRKATNFSGLFSLKFLLVLHLNKLAKLLNIKVFDREFTEYFDRLVLDAIKYREEKGIIRNDLINMLMAVRKGKTSELGDDKTQSNDLKESFAAQEESDLGLKTVRRNWSDDEIVAQCFVFFIAGFETTATLMCFCAHELMRNPDVQEKLIEEVDEMNRNLDGKPITYEALQKMKYLDMVISETLRMWTPATQVDRVCTKPYTLKDDVTGTSINLQPGDVLWLPIIGLHHNPEYFPNPEIFDPERFSDENKNNIKPLTYIPFGVGPRLCIGSRFALMEAKSIIYQILTKFTIEKSSKTEIPINLKNSGFSLQPKAGFWLSLKPRE